MTQNGSLTNGEKRHFIRSPYLHFVIESWGGDPWMCSDIVQRVWHGNADPSDVSGYDVTPVTILPELVSVLLDLKVITLLSTICFYF